MRKVKTFFHIFINSLLPHYPYYHKLIHTSFSFSFRYFVFLTLVLYMFGLYSFSVKNNIKDIPKALSAFSNSLNSYPEDLTVSINDGALTTNYNHPFFLWMDYNNNKILLIVIDINASSEMINQYNSIALMTRNNIVIRNASNLDQYTSTSLKGISGTITKASLSEFDAILNNIFKLILIIVPIIIFLLFPVILFVNFLLAIIITLFVFFIAKFFHPHLVFKKNLQLTLHALTIPFIVDYSLGITNIPKFTTIIAFVVLAFIFSLIAVHETYFKFKAK